MTTCTIIRLGRADEFGRAFVVGQVYTGVQAFVRDLVASGHATTTDSLIDGGFPANIAPADSMNSAQVSAVQALVSGAGNVTAAALPALVGTPGAVVRLSDGPDQGAALIWAQPSGSTTYAWCWFAWPQAAY